MAKAFKMTCPRCRWREYDPIKADECVSCETDRKQLAAELKRDRERERDVQAAARKPTLPSLAPVPYCGSCLTTLQVRDAKDGVGICVRCKQQRAPQRTTLANSYAASSSAKQTDVNRVY
jgi:hypothetical protein